MDGSLNERLSEGFSGIEHLYIADGHHRAASAVKVGLKRREENPGYSGTEEFNYFLSVIFPDEELADIVMKHFDLRPAAIIRDLDLRRPIYKQVAAYGHFGRTDIDVPWERLNKVDELKAELG